MGNHLSRITVDPEICGGRSWIRDLRIRVSDIPDLFAAAASRDEILGDYPYLEADDITTALECGSAAAGHRVIASRSVLRLASADGRL